MFKLFLSINTEAIFDTLSANHVAETLYWQLSNECFINIIDMGYKIGTIIITIINLIYIIKINNFRKKSSKIQQKKEQKIDLFKTIVGQLVGILSRHAIEKQKLQCVDLIKAVQPVR